MPLPKMRHTGLFVGLTTLDFIYLSQNYPHANQKVVAQDYLTAAGGPATNAGVAFSYFGNQGKLLTVLGQHPLCNLIQVDLANYPVEIIDLMPEKIASPPVSSIIVTATTGERAVISINAQKSQAKSWQIPEEILSGVDIVLIDGHQMEVSLAIALAAKKQQIPLVIDCGSWKPGFEKVLAVADYAVCSANFYPPQCDNLQDVLNFLQRQKIEKIAITQGGKPIICCDRHNISSIPVPTIDAIDTLGAGDIFHGAFCHHILEADFPNALALASQIASESCRSFGSRNWYYS